MFWPWKNCTYRENAFWPPCEEKAHRMAHKKSYIKASKAKDIKEILFKKEHIIIVYRKPSKDIFSR